MMGSDSVILKKTEKILVKTKGRPKVSRDLVTRLLAAGYSTPQIKAACHCSDDTVYRIRDEMVNLGKLQPEGERRKDQFVEGDFDLECKRATGFSYYDWLNTKTKSAQQIFSFCQKVWDQVWERPSLFQAKDQNDQLGDQLCIKFLQAFAEDNARIRRRKKVIRNLFRFLGRHDLCDRHLTMTNARDPRAIRRLPVLEMPDFPLKLQSALDKLSDEDRLIVELKLCTQMRTGKAKEERGVFGIRKNAGKSYLVMDSPDVFRFHVLEKMREEWDITHLPPHVRAKLFALYETKQDGEYLFRHDEDLNKRWSKATASTVGMALNLHDSRKISVTWFYACGLPLEIATSLNVGWKDLNTPRDHYLHLRQLLRKSEKAKYVSAIPDWFKVGLDEYREE